MKINLPPFFFLCRLLDEAPGGVIEVTCEFCKYSYGMGRADVLAVLAEEAA